MFSFFRKTPKTSEDTALTADDDFEDLTAEVIQTSERNKNFKLRILPTSELRMEARTRGLFTAFKQSGVTVYEPKADVFVFHDGEHASFFVLSTKPTYSLKQGALQYHGDHLQVSNHKNMQVPLQKFVTWLNGKSNIGAKIQNKEIIIRQNMKKWLIHVPPGLSFQFNIEFEPVFV